jgi:hypothetical protein
VWVTCEIFLNNMTGPWTAFAISTAACLGSGLVALRWPAHHAPASHHRRHGDGGHHDPISVAARDRLEGLAATLLVPTNCWRAATFRRFSMRWSGGRSTNRCHQRGARMHPSGKGVVAQLFQVLSLMAVPAVILLTIRYLIVRQNRLAASITRCT